MIEYLPCNEVSRELVFSAFQAGFADYMIKFAMTAEDFFKRFLGPEGNQLEHSFIALAAGHPSGLVLGGIRDFAGRRSMRCGTMCVIPEYRMRGVSVRLFQLHREQAQRSGCQQLVLEVISRNLPAVRFYKSCGYEKVYDLHYFSLADGSGLQPRKKNNAPIREVAMADLRLLRQATPDIHLNWQNEIAAQEKLEGQVCYGFKDEAGLAAALSMNRSGKFHFLWVRPSQRGRGLATALLAHAAAALNLQKLETSFTNNAPLECFLRHIGFVKERLAQYEMFLPLE